VQKKSPAKQGKGVFAHFCAGGGNVTNICLKILEEIST